MSTLSPRARNRRAAREILEGEHEAAARRLAQLELAMALAARTAPGIAPYEPSALMLLFQADSASAWARLAGMTRSQRINQAIEVACWLEGLGVAVVWGQVLERWERRLAELAGAGGAEG